MLRATNGLYEIRKVLHEIEKSGGGFLLLPRETDAHRFLDEMRKRLQEFARRFIRRRPG